MLSYPCLCCISGNVDGLAARSVEIEKHELKGVQTPDHSFWEKRFNLSPNPHVSWLLLAQLL